MKVIILCIIGKYLAGSVPILATALFFIQRFYLRTSRQVRLLNIEAKAPLYSNFLETVQGLSTIRAYGRVPEFLEQSQQLLDQSQKPVYMLFSIQQCLTLVLDLVVGVLAVVIVTLMTSVKNEFSATSIGVALNLVLTFNQDLTHTIKMWTMMEISIGAVSRVKQFVQDTPSDTRTGQVLTPEMGWPLQGAVQFEKVTACYRYASLLHCAFTLPN
jgi:ATP-binding cassette subfamily C (CFTR/MRP) protein 1